VFKHVGRRLALLNTIIVIVLVAAIGVLTYGALRRSLVNEVDRALEERLTVALSGVSESGDVRAVPTVEPEDDDEDGEDEEDEEDEDHDEDEHDEDREIVSSGDTILIRIDRDGQVVENPRDITLPDVPVEAGVEHALGGEMDVRSVTLPDGERMRVMTAPVVDDGQVIGAVQALRSLGEHEEQLEIVRNMTLLGVGLGIIVAGPAGFFLSRQAMAPINAAFGRQRAFVADASHELRTPLTLIRANAELIRRKPERSVADVLPSLDSIVREVDGMAQLVNDLLTLARLDAGKLELALAEQDLADVVGPALESMRPLAEDGEVTLRLEADRDVMAVVDRARIQQVVRILLDNAIRHTPPGGEVTVSVAASGSWRTIEVRDTGSGIAPEELPYIFERFSRQDRARGRDAGGAGLGLAIARGLIEQHGGLAEIHSSPGEGTRVVLRLPERAP
jgi:signal transduction histidine kinase